MYKLCKTEQSTARQRLLEQELLALMLQKRYEDISVSDLCDRIPVPRKSFYRYFSSKDGALFALLDHTMLEFPFSLAERSSALQDLTHFFEFWYQQKALLDALERSSLSGILVERATALASQERMMPQSLLRFNANLQDIALSFAVCGVMSMVIRWHHQGFQETPGEMSSLATSLLSRPLLPL